MDTCKVIEVVETSLTRRGKGEEEDPVRIITQYWSKDGTLLAEVDCAEKDVLQFKMTRLLDNLRSHVEQWSKVKNKEVVDVANNIVDVIDTCKDTVQSEDFFDLKTWRR